MQSCLSDRLYPTRLICLSDILVDIEICCGVYEIDVLSLHFLHLHCDASDFFSRSSVLKSIVLFSCLLDDKSFTDDTVTEEIKC